MTHTIPTYTLTQVEATTGIPAEEVHARLWKGELPGEGNTAMPGNRRFGTVNAETMEKLATEGRLRRTAVVEQPVIQRNHFQALPIGQVAEELGMTVREVEGLLYKRELEGPMLNHRYTGVTHASLSAYRKCQEDALRVEAVEAALIPATVDNPELYDRQGIKVEMFSLDRMKAFLTGRSRT